MFWEYYLTDKSIYNNEVDLAEGPNFHVLHSPNP